MKIKTKKQLNLPQLIEWAWDNSIKDMYFRRLNRRTFEYIWVNEESNIEFDDEMIFKKDDIFEVDEMEEIKEDTVLSKVLIVFKNESTEFIEGLSVEDIYKSSVDSIYHVRNDKTMTFIWTKENGLVE